jgi:hypothetical protein
MKSIKKLYRKPFAAIKKNNDKFCKGLLESSSKGESRASN